MSADNGIYILATTDNHKRINEYTTVNLFGKGITAYRVAHCFAIDNLNYTEKNDIHNLGFYFHTYFGDSEVYYSRGDALDVAKLLDENGYSEYGICELDFTDYNFPAH